MLQIIEICATGESHSGVLPHGGGVSYPFSGWLGFGTGLENATWLQERNEIHDRGNHATAR